MAITAFGKAVRKARIDTDETMVSMAETLGVSVAFLSSLEYGRKKIPTEWVEKIGLFFAERGKVIKNLQNLADVSNENVAIDNLPFEHQMLISHFAKTRLSPEQLEQVATLMKQWEDSNKNKENE